MEITINSSMLWLRIWECPVSLFKELELFMAKEPLLTKGTMFLEMFSAISRLLLIMVVKVTN